ncbi:hypothetical protein [Mycolicibacterium austroafricanum]|uniref:hypothetical protein n=1 Tax=Mycolicibacterium austroafricanum TaxID=39687 RepID=UPI0011AE551A|nr:hypothetical protein [Mycolicibacterium austroafricanum]QZY47786.1 hypothetical protein K5L12_08805 [Mycolicibacterium austroafricanum]
MEIQELWRVMTHRWRVVLTTVLVCVSVALAWALAGPVTYTAAGNVVISTYGSLGTANDAFAGEQVSQQRAPTYAQLLRGPEIAARASALLNGEISPKTIDDAVDARIVSRIPLVTVTATMPSPNDAVRVVVAVERAFQQYVNEIERPGRDGSLTAVRLSGDPPSVVRNGNPVRDALLSVLLGLILGTVLAVYRDRTDPIVRSPGQIAGLGFRHLGSIDVCQGHPVAGDAFRRLAVECARLDCSADMAARVILVTGCEPGDDSPSLIAAGLAKGITDCGRPAALVSASPGDGTSRGGLSDVLEGEQSWSDCVSVGPAGVAVMDSGTKGGALDRIVLAMGPKARLPEPSKPGVCTVIEGPSIVHSSITVALTAVVDRALIVATRGRTKVDDLLEAKLTLEAMNTPIAGLVLARPVKPRPEWRPSPVTRREPAQVTDPQNYHQAPTAARQ